MVHRACYSTKPERVVVLTEKQLKLLSSQDHSASLLDWQEKVQTVDITTQEPVDRSSPAADLGRKRIGMVSLPSWLTSSVQEIIQESNKPLLRTDALRLYESLRSTGKQDLTDPKTAAAVEPHTLSYGPRESLAYMAGVMPSNFGTLSNILHEIQKRLPELNPRTILDFGTGPGTAIWAAKEVFGIKTGIGIDLSENMLRLAERLAQDGTITWKRYLAPHPPSDLVMAAYTLNELPSDALRQSTLLQLWEQTADCLVLVERGTPVGFTHLARARQWILNTGEAHVVAPCPHDKPCPLMYSPDARPNKMWCHFSQRIQRPSFLMKTKHSKRNIEDATYSYVVLRRGTRPETPRPAADANDTTPSSLYEQSFQWPRLIQPPLKRQGHVVMDVCTQSGEIQRTVIPKSQGKVAYRDARKAMWGDAFPHPSKTKSVTRMSQGVITAEEN